MVQLQGAWEMSGKCLACDLLDRALGWKARDAGSNCSVEEGKGPRTWVSYSLHKSVRPVVSNSFGSVGQKSGVEPVHRLDQIYTWWCILVLLWPLRSCAAQSQNCMQLLLWLPGAYWGHLAHPTCFLWFTPRPMSNTDDTAPLARPGHGPYFWHPALAYWAKIQEILPSLPIPFLSNLGAERF